MTWRQRHLAMMRLERELARAARRYHTGDSGDLLELTVTAIDYAEAVRDLAKIGGAK